MENASFAATYDGTRQALIVTGELDEETSLELRDAIETHTGSYARPLAVDLSAVDYLPSAAVGVLAQALQKSGTGEHPLELVAADGTIAQRVLQVCALPHRAG
ncbi:STAS domain-containing protein [Nocardioides plantarum]|uniref:STAS domain-containing protein n=1 Tax=Nocardioides plantarum TaxID=29299 RepID=A0ABV5KCT8_9ACTN|nr:STAS domain-containing protein [Nocardioides plantarum]